MDRRLEAILTFLNNLKNCFNLSQQFKKFSYLNKILIVSSFHTRHTYLIKCPLVMQEMSK